MDKKTSFNVWYLIAAVLGWLIFQGVFQQASKTTPLAYSEFQKYLEEGRLDELVVTESRDRRPDQGCPGR